MRHARDDALDKLEGLLEQIRQNTRLKEKTRGVFYLSGSAALHFHEDETGLFADLKLAGTWERFDVTLPDHQRAFLATIAVSAPAMLR